MKVDQARAAWTWRRVQVGGIFAMHPLPVMAGAAVPLTAATAVWTLLDAMARILVALRIAVAVRAVSRCEPARQTDN